MSSPPTSSDQNDAADEAPAEEAQSPASEEPETAVEPVECPNCGHEFAGNYCPECGQEADPSASVVEMIGGFFRELVDVEHGFWPTFVELTLRPGEVLRQYLSGVRAGLISPGRYLLAAVVVSVGVDQLLAWIGISPRPGTDSEASTSLNGAEGGVESGEAVEVATIYIVPDESTSRAIFVVLLAGLLSLLLYRLFDDELERMGEALAISSYLVGHALFLITGVDLLYESPASLFTGQPVETPGLFTVVIPIGYVGFAAYQGLDPGWKSALKGGLAIIWAFVEAALMLMVCAAGFAAGLILMYPDRYVPTGGTSGEELLHAAIVGLLSAIPLLVHAGVEVYLRYRD